MFSKESFELFHKKYYVHFKLDSKLISFCKSAHKENNLRLTHFIPQSQALHELHCADWIRQLCYLCFPHSKADCPAKGHLSTFGEDTVKFLGPLESQPVWHSAGSDKNNLWLWLCVWGLTIRKYWILSFLPVTVTARAGTVVTTLRSEL